MIAKKHPCSFEYLWQFAGEEQVKYHDLDGMVPSFRARQHGEIVYVSRAAALPRSPNEAVWR